MPTLEVPVWRFSVVSARSFDDVVSRLTASIGRPEMDAFRSEMTAARTMADLEKVVQGAIGSSELMEFVRFDAGEVLRKECGELGAKFLRLVVGNPIIMKEMARTVPDLAGNDLDRRARGWRAPVLRLDGEPARSLRQSGSSRGGEGSRREG
jgi:hypothetical protein